MTKNKPMPEAALTDHLNLMVCKSEYDSWTQAQPQHQAPPLSLYLDGRLLKGTKPNIQELDETKTQNDAVSKDRDKCDKSNSTATASEDAALAAESVAKSAGEKAAAAKSDSDKASTKADAEKADATAKAAREKANADHAVARKLYQFEFDLDSGFLANADDRDSWLPLLSKPWNNAPLLASCGPATGAWPSGVSISFTRINQGWLWAWAALFAVLLVFFLIYAKRSDILRDTGTLPAGTTAGTRKAFSIARVQMALWTFLIAAALAFIFMVTWNENVLSASALVLMGISSGTTVLAAVADGTQPVPGPTQGFFNDLVDDGQGPSVHRYQMFIFTLVLAIIFITKVATNLVMPEFDATLLGLMGISNGTYLGFKLQGR